MKDRPFSHPDFGKQVRLEQYGLEIRLTFIAATPAKAESLFNSIGEQLKAGALNLTLMGKPTEIVEE